MLMSTLRKGHFTITRGQLRDALGLDGGVEVLSIAPNSGEFVVYVSHPSLPKVDNWHSSRELTPAEVEGLCADS
jgi:hypothetical protein